ncbi:hypothetical protein NET03_07870 [Thermomicrobium sp. CFH 73360]|uniref:hypothetical protein n=1 Tax=Thermomicrobium sp. CFH 73360 TaxID=2951987 RepID=UPI0020778154|nr:hypothetical protein [Thermomicrobium sp. CFH 73360]MCM8746450.1 hypothetical protein [Thermomicrobium sp. CFH 73360]
MIEGVDAVGTDGGNGMYIGRFPYGRYARAPQPDLTVEDLRRVYVLVPREDGRGDENITVAEMTDRQFREWIVAKAALHGVPLIPPLGRIGLETRVHLLNYLIHQGVRIYLVPKPEA